MVGLAIQALMEGDAGLAEDVLLMDDEIDSMNRQTQEVLVQAMEETPACAMQALNALIVSRSLERVGDHATNIAEDVIFWVRGSDVRHQMSLADAE
jgi:phosphate transport system protein